MTRRLSWLVLLVTTFILSLSTTLAQPIARGSVEIVVNRDDVNVRIAPALGAEVIGFVDAGWRTTANGRSPDSQWLRVDFNGNEGWIGFPVITVVSGDVNALPVGDPRSIPYGGFESPRAGSTSASSPVSGRLADSGVRLRAGPSTAYPVLANPLRYSVFPLLGRTANNAWIQVNFEGTLGWVTASWVEIQNGASIIELPIDGIVASSVPLSEETRDNYYGVLQLMLDRLNLAQPSLDQIRGTWTTVALGERSACQNFPARPSDINIAQPLLAAFYDTLDPLRVDFNLAMGQLRLAIDLWIEACGQPSPPNGVVGAATVSGALNAIQIVDAKFADLRARITALLPSFELASDECLFTFEEQFDILQILQLGQVFRQELTPRRPVAGYCFDATVGQSIRIELLQIRGNLRPLVSFSPFNNPTQFLGVSRNLTGEDVVTLGPISITADGRYLIVVSDESDERNEPLFSDYVILVTNVAGIPLPGPGLGIDAQGQVVVNPVQPSLISTPFPSITLTGTPSTGVVVCPSLSFTCTQLATCAEAQACRAAGNFTLDTNVNGIPCGTGDYTPINAAPALCG
jgi:uncharacterized protein YraI